MRLCWSLEDADVDSLAHVGEGFYISAQLSTRVYASQPVISTSTQVTSGELHVTWHPSGVCIMCDEVYVEDALCDADGQRQVALRALCWCVHIKRDCGWKAENRNLC